MKKRMIASVFAAVLVAALVLSGCGSTAAKTDNGPVSVKISAINAVSWAPVFIAETEGFFKEEGLAVEFTTPGGPKGFQAMHAGDCEFAMLSQEPLLIAQEQGMESKVVAAMLKSRVYGLIATPDITEISQLQGKTIFGSDAGSAPYVFVSNVLSMAGLDPLSDVTFIQVSDNNAGLQAFINGEVSAAFVNMYTLPAVEEFDYVVLADTTDEEQCEKYLGSSEFPGEMLCTTAAFAEEDADTCQKVVNAVMKAQAWIADHTDEEVAASLSPIFGSLPEDIIAAEIALVRDTYATDCMVTEYGQKAVIDMCVKAGVISREIPYEEVIDMSFVKGAEK